MAAALALEKPPQGNFSSWRRRTRRNRFASPDRLKRKSRHRLRRTSSAPVFANGAVTGAFAYAFGRMAQEARNRLSYTTLEGPTQGPDGQANWRIKWQLEAGSKEGGWVVQEMTVDISAGGAEVHEHYWEAWEVPAGADGAYGSDTWAIDGRRYDSGAVTWTGTARFHEGLTLPGSFSPNSVQAAGSAWATRANPNLPTSPAPVSRVFTYSW